MTTPWIAAEHLVLIAGLVFTLGYLIINQVLLRVMILVGTGFYIWYYFVVADTPLWTAIWTSCAMGVANILGLMGLFARNSKLAVPQAHRDIYPLFPGLPPGDFRELMRFAQRRTLEADTRVTTEGAPNTHLVFVVSGGMRVTKGDARFRLPSGTFVGEVAYLNHQNAAATTDILAGSEVLEWPVDALRARARRKARFKLALEAMISRDLAAKVAFAVAPRMEAFQDAVPPASPPASSSVA